MPKKPAAPRRSRVKEAHHVLEDALRKAAKIKDNRFLFN